MGQLGNERCYISNEYSVFLTWINECTVDGQSALSPFHDSESYVGWEKRMKPSTSQVRLGFALTLDPCFCERCFPDSGKECWPWGSGSLQASLWSLDSDFQVPNTKHGSHVSEASAYTKSRGAGSQGRPQHFCCFPCTTLYHTRPQLSPRIEGQLCVAVTATI